MSPNFIKPGSVNEIGNFIELNWTDFFLAVIKSAIRKYECV